MNFEEFVKNLKKLWKRKDIPLMHIDIDDWKKVKALRTIIKAVQLFGKENVRVIISGSRSAIQIEIKPPRKLSPIELIFLYHYLQSDAYRTMNTAVRIITNPDTKLTDISFGKKMKPDGYVGTSLVLNVEEVLPEGWEKVIDDIKMEDVVFKEYIKRISKYMRPYYLINMIVPKEVMVEFVDNFKEIRPRIVKLPNSEKFALLVKVYSEDRVHDILEFLKKKNITEYEVSKVDNKGYVF